MYSRLLVCVSFAFCAAQADGVAATALNIRPTVESGANVQNVQSRTMVRNITCGGGIPGIDHAYGDLKPYIPNISTTSACCALCQDEPKCVAWVLETDTHLCFLKAVTSGTPCTGGNTPCRRSMPNRISMANCPDGPTPPPPPPPAPPVPHWLPVANLSKPYRNWTYYIGQFDGFVVPPDAGNFPGQTLVDCPLVYQKTPEDALPGKYRMAYLFFNGTKGNMGYEVGLGTSDDLLHWSFGQGGDRGIVFPRNPVEGTFDYGGVTLGGMLWDNMEIKSPRLPQKLNGKYWCLYGCYPSREGYEAGDGGQGMAWSSDGVQWHRLSNTTPITPGGNPSDPKWEQITVYQPNLVESNGTFYDIYNAAGINAAGNHAEESGVRTLAVSDFPGLDATQNRSLWVDSPKSPVLPSGPPGSVDNRMASDPKVFWDAEQQVWVNFYVCGGDATGSHVDICIAFSTDLLAWDKEDTPLYRAGGHPSGIDSSYAHKVSVIYDHNGVGYLYYTAVGSKGRGIALLTSRPVQ